MRVWLWYLQYFICSILFAVFVFAFFFVFVFLFVFIFVFLFVFEMLLHISKVSAYDERSASSLMRLWLWYLQYLYLHSYLYLYSCLYLKFCYIYLKYLPMFENTTYLKHDDGQHAAWWENDCSICSELYIGVFLSKCPGTLQTHVMNLRGVRVWLQYYTNTFYAIRTNMFPKLVWGQGWIWNDRIGLVLHLTMIPLLQKSI